MAQDKISFADFVSQRQGEQGEPEVKSTGSQSFGDFASERQTQILEDMKKRKQGASMAKETSAILEQDGVPQKSLADKILGGLGDITGAGAIGRMAGRTILEGKDIVGDLRRGENTPTIDAQKEFLKGAAGTARLGTMFAGGGAAMGAKTFRGAMVKSGIAGAIGGGVEGGLMEIEETGDIDLNTLKEAGKTAAITAPITAALPVVGTVLSRSARKVINTFNGQEALRKANKDVFRAIKPRLTTQRNLKTTEDKLSEASQAVVDAGFAPKTTKEFANSIAETKKILWKEIQGKIDASDQMVNVRDIANDVAALADNKALLSVDPNAAERIKKISEALVSQGDEVGVQEAEGIKQLINAELQGAFGQFNLSKHEQNAKKLITKKIGEQLDEKLSKVSGEFQGLKNKYGALSDIEEDVLKRVIVFERANPEGLVDSISKLSGIGEILKGLASSDPSSVVKGVGQITLGKIQKNANNADLLIEKAFKRIANPKNPLFNKNSPLLNVKQKGSVQIDKILPGAKLLDKTDDLVAQAKKVLDTRKNQLLLPTESLRTPKIVYRGVSGSGGGISSIGGGGAVEGVGLYTTTKKSVAKGYADSFTDGKVLELSPQGSIPSNPIYFRNTDAVQDFEKILAKDLGMPIWKFNEEIGLNKVIKDMGHDGVAFDMNGGITYVKYK